ncbi:hypothetical protein DL769_007839 [Monosporascus sp. CRB-8-3]|nr:hypothetical protein DL769_007839 [Monosporascus sp. CRB-8-3]
MEKVRSSIFTSSSPHTHPRAGKVILAVRNEEKGKAAAAKLTSDLKLKEDVNEVWRLELSAYESVVAFAERTKSLPTLDIVVLTASLWSPSRAFNKRTGHEETIQVARFTKFKEKNEVPLLAALDKKDIGVDAMDRMFLSKLLQQFFYTELANRVPLSIALINGLFTQVSL